MQKRVCAIKTTFEEESEAAAMAELLLDKQLIASGQVCSVHSAYVWQGKRFSKQEYELTCFTERRFVREIEELILEHHSYELPEFVCIPIDGASKEFADWIDDSLKKD